MTPFGKEQVPWIENGYYIDRESSQPPSRHPYYFAGLYYLQEPSAMAPPRFFPSRRGTMYWTSAQLPEARPQNWAQS